MDNAVFPSNGQPYRPPGTDAEYAQQLKNRIAGALQNVIVILNEAREAGFDLATNVGPSVPSDPSSPIALLNIRVTKTY